ncbi:MAG TPA: glycosyltransferase family 1 protein [Candidatus Dormibacteraeota bacterium]|nr:glycosyltransferase family 1 protein [Candidatus Dormibacteraeota bacterium]
MNSPSERVLAIDATRMARERTGIENYLHHILPGIVKGWSAPAQPGVAHGTVKVFARYPTFADDVDPRPDVIASAARGWTQLALPGALRKAGASVYFSPIPILPMFRQMPCPAVVTVHDLHDFRPRWWYFRRLLQRTFSTASGIICVSQATHAALADEFPGLADKAVVIREGADPAVFRPRSTSPESGPQIDDNGVGIMRRLGIKQPPLLAVGTVQPRKNYSRLIAAYASLPPDSTPPLVIVGRAGWDYEEVMALPDRLGVGGRVIFTGHLPEADVAALMRASVALCAVSSGEGFGLPLVEAMYSGLPILASDIPPFREVAGTAARFVDPASEGAIARGLGAMLADPGARQEMAQVGLNRRQLFSWDTAAAAIVELLRSLTKL